jgi:hypothetical protein
LHCSTNSTYQNRAARFKAIFENLAREEKIFRAQVRVVAISETMRRAIALSLASAPTPINFRHAFP